jgi:uncharacterized protein YbgA (DUF1722 family)/uncharacterized protein YbbK (DUF523 family)
MRCGILSPHVGDGLPDRPVAPIPIAISECLLGSRVRYDGGSSRPAFAHSVLDGALTYRGICPEVGIGMGTPRAPIRLIDAGRVVAVDDASLDYTTALRDFGIGVAKDLRGVAGYVFMQNSPSCGLFQVKVHSARGGNPNRGGRGAHARAVVDTLPDLPVEENARLNDPVLRENFLTRVFAFAHWQACFGHEPGAPRLAEFHTRYKYLLMAHSAPHCQRAEALLNNANSATSQKVVAYRGLLMEGLSSVPSVAGHTQVLSHIAANIGSWLPSEEHLELADLVSGYQRGEQPLAAPLALLERNLLRHPAEFALCQSYIDPHPGFPSARHLA